MRRALGDDADDPQYVETVIGKGYRWIAAVEHGEPGSLPPFPVAGGQARIILLRSAPKAPDQHFPPHSSPSSAAAATALNRLPMGISAPPGEVGTGLRTSIRRGGVSLIAAVALGVAGTFVWLQVDARREIALLGFERITTAGGRKPFKIGELPLPVVTDGSRVYFEQAGVEETFAVSQVSANGGEAGSFPTLLPSPVALDVSADGSKLLLESPASLPEGPLWVQPVPEGSPAPLAGLKGGGGSWSPDGTRVVLGRRDGLYPANQDGAGAHAIVHSRSC